MLKATKSNCAGVIGQRFGGFYWLCFHNKCADWIARDSRACPKTHTTCTTCNIWNSLQSASGYGRESNYENCVRPIQAQEPFIVASPQFLMRQGTGFPNRCGHTYSGNSKHHQNTADPVGFLHFSLALDEVNKAISVRNNTDHLDLIDQTWQINLPAYILLSDSCQSVNESAVAKEIQGIINQMVSDCLDGIVLFSLELSPGFTRVKAFALSHIFFRSFALILSKDHLAVSTAETGNNQYYPRLVHILIWNSSSTKWRPTPTFSTMGRLERRRPALPNCIWYSLWVNRLETAAGKGCGDFGYHKQPRWLTRSPGYNRQISQVRDGSRNCEERGIQMYGVKKGLARNGNAISTKEVSWRVGWK